MRNRDYKNSAPGGYYHIYNRGNAKQDIFRNAEDYRFFLLRLRQNLQPNGSEPQYRFRSLPADSFSLVAYCLMPNHYHLLIRQNSEISTSVLIGKICTSYSMYFNKKYDRVGHLFQDQFKQISVDDDRYLMWLASYIHLNPVKAGFVHDAIAYQWSSMGEYGEITSSHICDKDIILGRFEENTKKEYANYVKECFLTDQKTVPDKLCLDE